MNETNQTIIANMREAQQRLDLLAEMYITMTNVHARLEVEDVAGKTIEQYRASLQPHLEDYWEQQKERYLCVTNQTLLRD